MGLAPLTPHLLCPKKVERSKGQSVEWPKLHPLGEKKPYFLLTPLNLPFTKGENCFSLWLKGRRFDFL